MTVADTIVPTATLGWHGVVMVHVLTVGPFGPGAPIDPGGPEFPCIQSINTTTQNVATIITMRELQNHTVGPGDPGSPFFPSVPSLPYGLVNTGSSEHLCIAIYLLSAFNKAEFCLRQKIPCTRMLSCNRNCLLQNPHTCVIKGGTQ